MVKWLPYDIHSARERFQADISEIIEGLEKDRNNQDDTILWDRTLQEQNDCENKLITRIKKSGPKLSQNVFSASKIS